MLGGEVELLPEELADLDTYDMGERYAFKILTEAVIAAKEALTRYGLVEFLTEQRVNPGLRIGRDDFWGTGDLVAACAVTKTLAVLDLKTGRGRVEPECNDQLLAYAMGALDMLSFEPQRIVLGVIQPVIYGAKPRIWETDRATLAEFEVFVQERAAKVDDPATAPEPGDGQCRWCPAKGHTCNVSLK